MIGDGVIFCGEPWECVWTEEQVTELDSVLNDIFANTSNEVGSLQRKLSDRIRELSTTCSLKNNTLETV